jgi:dTDP-4-dehydrorhamnose 3,5-epimerase
MLSRKTSLPEVILFTPEVHEDVRGFFFESFRHDFFESSIGHKASFVQENHSKSQKDVLRGLHYQLEPMSQGKLVRVVHGEIFDVAVDIRKDSPTLGKWVAELLSAHNKRQLWIPEGFAHGFLTISESAELVYKTTNYYSPEHERCLSWDDSFVGVDWPQTQKPLLSKKDLVTSKSLKEHLEEIGTP